MTENFYSNLNEGHLSPRAITATQSARKRNKQGFGDTTQPVKVQPKTKVISLFAK